MTSLDLPDLRAKSPTMANSIATGLRLGSIVLMHDNEEHARRKRKRRKKRQYESTNEIMNDQAEQAVAPDSYPGLFSTQDLLGEPGRSLEFRPDFPSSQWPSFEMLEPLSSAMELINSSPPILPNCNSDPPPWPDVQSVITIENTNVDPTQQAKDATGLSISILEHAQRWSLVFYPVEMLSDTFERFGGCVLILKYRLGCVDTLADPMIKSLESKHNDPVSHRL